MSKSNGSPAPTPTGLSSEALGRVLALHQKALDETAKAFIDLGGALEDIEGMFQDVEGRLRKLEKGLYDLEFEVENIGRQL